MDSNVLRQALANTADPPPPHLYAQMARWTYMDGKTQQKFFDAVFAALHGESGFSLRTLTDTITSAGSSSNAHNASSATKDKVHVLYKALHLIKVMCETGSADFQKAAQRLEHMERIRALCHFHAPADPIYGDAFNAKVRREAQAALQATLAPRSDIRFTSASGAAQSASTLQQRTTGFGSGVVVEEEEDKKNEKRETRVEDGTQWRSRVAEMPTRNTWAEHMASAQGEPQKATSNKPQAETGNLFEHLAQSAKDAMRLLREHEALRTEADTTGLTKAQRKQRAQLLATSHSSSGGFVPLDTSAIAVLPPNTTTTTSSTTAFAFLRPDAGSVATRLHTSPASPQNDSVGSHRAESGPSSNSNNNSAFHFLSSASPEADRRESTSRQDESPVQSSASVTSPFHALLDKYTQRSTSTASLSRSELASFVHECVELVVSSQLTTHTSETGNDRSARMEALCETLEGRLGLQRPWLERLHALGCLAALLQRVPPSLATGDVDVRKTDKANAFTGAQALNDAFGEVATHIQSTDSVEQALAVFVYRYFRQHASAVRRNTSVVQASLREKACAVLHSLRLDTSIDKVEEGKTEVKAEEKVKALHQANTVAAGLSWAGMKVRQADTQPHRTHTGHVEQTTSAQTLQGLFDDNNTTTTTHYTTTTTSTLQPHSQQPPITEEELFGTTTQVMAPPPQAAMQWPPVVSSDSEGYESRPVMQSSTMYEAGQVYEMPPPAPVQLLQSNQGTGNVTTQQQQRQGRRVFAEVQAEMRAKMADTSST